MQGCSILQYHKADIDLELYWFHIQLFTAVYGSLSLIEKDISLTCSSRYLHLQTNSPELIGKYIAEQFRIVGKLKRSGTELAFEQLSGFIQNIHMIFTFGSVEKLSNLQEKEIVIKLWIEDVKTELIFIQLRACD